MMHKFRNICYDRNKLLNGVNKLSTFMSRLTKQSEENHNMGWTPDEYKGMGFEALIEVLITSSPIDKRINITDYVPATPSIHGKDVGIDGYGKSHNGNEHTVQMKFRSRVDKVLTANQDHTSNFVAATRTNPLYRDADMTIFTTAKELDRTTKIDMYNSSVRVVGYLELTKLLDANDAFWNTFRKEMS